MINLHTGLPGAGKTLFTLYFVKQLADKESRPVYYSGIADLKLPWVELEEPEKWFQLPPNSIVVIDECQRLFRPRGHGSKVPDYVAALETHRHGGIDLFLITQHPMLVDSNVRRLVGAHRHVVRNFGMQRATVHQWGEVREQAGKSRADSVRLEFGYPKEVYGWYKSAEVHTHKRTIPARLWFLLALPLIIAAIAWGFVSWTGRYFVPPSERGKEPEALQAVRQLGGDVRSPARSIPANTREAWFASRVPRVPGLAFTAPVYDEQTRPVDPPIPMMCIEAKDRCTCYSQQSAKLLVELDVCRQIVANGLHLDFRASPPPQSGGEASQRQRATEL